ncbi:hypothetical protein H5410_041110 [Solanum commersonii]|uniref:Uncharacterized protein n=1 Tax=Solanum commersonii TaxID=4109 RepID=A0A9J5XTJ6_SOLCO|nr:hypothetical protein H5410_041110 [Solanum commersonii]
MCQGFHLILTIGIRAFDPTTCELKMDVRNTQIGIQSTLELILDSLTALERAPNRAAVEQLPGGGLLSIPGESELSPLALGEIEHNPITLEARNDWMKQHNPTKFDHERNCVTIRRKNDKLVLKGIFEEGKLSVINSGAMGKLLKKGNALFAHLFMMYSTTNQDQETEVILQNEGVDDIRMQETGQSMTINTTIPRKGKVYVGGNGDLRLQLIRKFHDSPLGGHSASCDVCHRNKDENAPSPGLLQPLTIPNQAWSHIADVMPVAILQRQQIKRNNVAIVKDTTSIQVLTIACSDVTQPRVGIVPIDSVHWNIRQDLGQFGDSPNGLGDAHEVFSLFF